MSARYVPQQGSGCVGLSALGACQAEPKFSVSEHLDQSTDYRVCGRHLSWFVSWLTLGTQSPVVVARLTRESQ